MKKCDRSICKFLGSEQFKCHEEISHSISQNMKVASSLMRRISVLTSLGLHILDNEAGFVFKKHRIDLSLEMSHSMIYCI